MLARQLKRLGYKFRINVLGVGPKSTIMKKLINKYSLQNEVILLGSVSSDNVRDYMLDADISLITSDRREGWGAVVNESMNSACAVVACENVGAVPYLIDSDDKGLTFRDCDWDTMCKHVIYLIENTDVRINMGIKSYKQIENVWNAENAAKNLLKLIESIQEGKDAGIAYGPCSHAPIRFRRSKLGLKTL